MLIINIYFFFSSRRRHTRYIGDWSSDVCSSDLSKHQGEFVKAFAPANAFTFVFFLLDTLSGFLAKDLQSPEMKFLNEKRSEERRVGKECRSRWSAYH